MPHPWVRSSVPENFWVRLVYCFLSPPQVLVNLNKFPSNPFPLLKYPVMFPQTFFFPSSFCQNWQWSSAELFTCKKYIRKKRMTANWKSIRYHSGNLVRSKLFSWIEGEVHPIPFDFFLHLNGEIVKAIFRLFSESFEQLLHALLIAQIF